MQTHRNTLSLFFHVKVISRGILLNYVATINDQFANILMNPLGTYIKLRKRCGPRFEASAKNMQIVFQVIMIT